MVVYDAPYMLQSAVNTIMVSKDIHPCPNLQTHPLEMGKLSLFFQVDPVYHQESYKKEAGGSELAEDVMAETEFGLIKERGHEPRNMGSF